MKLYDGGRAPNPRRVRIFLAEKGITVPTEQVDLGKLQQRVGGLYRDQSDAAGAGARARRRHGDRGIDRHLPLFRGAPARSAAVRPRRAGERAGRNVEQARRAALCFPVASVFQHLHPAMKQMVDPQVPEWGEANKPRVFAFLQFLDGELKDRPFVAGRELQRRRHHRAGRGRFHAGVETRGAGRARQCASAGTRRFRPVRAPRPRPALAPCARLRVICAPRGVMVPYPSVAFAILGWLLRKNTPMRPIAA